MIAYTLSAAMNVHAIPKPNWGLRANHLSDRYGTWDDQKERSTTKRTVQIRKSTNTEDQTRKSLLKIPSASPVADTGKAAQSIAHFIVDGSWILVVKRTKPSAVLMTEKDIALTKCRFCSLTTSVIIGS
jgi:hypothetical protein